MTLAFLEGVAVFAAVLGSILLWGYSITDWPSAIMVLSQAAVVAACSIVAFYYNDLYDFRIVRGFGGFVSRLMQSLGVTMILLAVVYTLFPRMQLAEGPFVSSMLMILGLLFPVRAAAYTVIRHPTFADRVLIVGSGSLARKLIEEIGRHPYYGYQVVGIADDGPVPDGPPVPYPLLGPLRDLVKIVADTGATRVVVAMRERRGRLPMQQLLEIQAQGIPIEDGLKTSEHFTKKLAIETLTPSLLIFSDGFRETRLQAGLRRLASLVVAAVGLVLTAPLMALTALAIKLDSPGPVLFVQERVGLRGRYFRLLKFRTMQVADGPMSEWVQDNADRITRVGAWLRKFRLDELPQFINILRGDMNLVGPRPHPASNWPLFVEKIPYYVLRAAVRPGVTGWAQVRYGYANNLDEEIEKMRYDLYYIRHVSFWFDVRILIDTVKTVLFGRGSQAPDAYGPDAVEADEDVALERRARRHSPRAATAQKSIGG